MNGQVRFPVAEVQDGNCTLFTLHREWAIDRFMVIKKPNGYGTALDACLIGGVKGYPQEGENVICRRCASAIYIPTIGRGWLQSDRIPLQVQGDDIVFDVSV